MFSFVDKTIPRCGKNRNRQRLPDDGILGTAWDRAETLVVPDVDAFPGHIACSSLSRSEIVVPLKREDGEVWGVLDIDSDDLGGFDETDARFLEEMIKML